MLNPAHDAIAMERTLVLQEQIDGFFNAARAWLDLHERAYYAPMESANAWAFVERHADGIQAELATFIHNVTVWGIAHHFPPGCLLRIGDISRTFTQHADDLLNNVVAGGMVRAVGWAHMFHLLSSVHDPYHEEIGPMAAPAA